jgi:L-amino acid N-acyltransferase YncA
MQIRSAQDADLDAVAAIYAHEVRSGVATFDVVPPPRSYWEARQASTEPGDHLVVAAADGEVFGYAYSASYRPRPAYALTREVSVYLAADARGRGLGLRLYDDLLPRLGGDGVHTALALVALPNDASLALHLACGFEQVGVLREVGRKFDRWIDTAWLQLMLE